MRPDECPICGQAHAPSCEELERVWDVEPTSGMVVGRGAPPPGFASWDAVEAWVRDTLALHAHESLGWNAGEATRAHQMLEAMWALSAKGTP